MANITDIHGAITHLFHTHNGESLSDEEIKVCVDHIVYWFSAINKPPFPTLDPAQFPFLYNIEGYQSFNVNYDDGVWSISYTTKPKKG